jgi:hypothetical protein
MLSMFDFLLILHASSLKYLPFMTTQEVADRFNELAQQGQFEQVLAELFSQDAKSIEPSHSAWQTVEGLDKIIEKGKVWHDMIEEMHGGHTSAPLVAGNFFTCTMGMDVTIRSRPLENGRGGCL